jgi:acetyl esterase/lipase
MPSPLASHALRLLRLSFGAASLLLAWLALFRAPTRRLWLLAIGVTEWGHWLGALALAPLVRPWRRAVGAPAATCGALAGLALLTPLLRALPVARELPGRLAAAFGAATPRSKAGAPPRPAPLVALDLFRGLRLPPVRLDHLRYQGGSGEALQLDLYRPLDDARQPGRGRTGEPEPLPVIVVVHGGGWEGGDRAQLPAANRYLASRGYAVAAISYRLAPRHPFPAARDDILAAIAYLKGSSGDLGLDPGRIVLCGRSAGGHLALLAGYTAGDPAIRGVVALYPPVDLRWGYDHPAARRVIDSRGVLERFLGGSPDSAGATYDAASPLTHVTPAPPTLIFHGGRDELVSIENSRRLAARLQGAGRPHLLVELPWATHGFDATLAGPGGQLLLFALERFLGGVL